MFRIGKRNFLTFIKRALQIENYLAICDAGAYGFVMASNYNSRGLPDEILINQNQYCLFRCQLFL